MAFATELEDVELNAEWEDVLLMLSKGNCIYESDFRIFLGGNKKMCSLLRNILLPFVAAIQMTCSVVSQVMMRICDEKRIVNNV